MTTTLLDLFDSAVARYGERQAVGIRRDDGTTDHWSYRELDRRARIAAWRLRAMDLEPGDRILTWSPSTPELAAAYYGAMRARLIFVPLDLRMSADAVSTVATASGARHLILGSGRDAPDPARRGWSTSRRRSSRPYARSPPRTIRPSRRTGKRGRRPGSNRPRTTSSSWSSRAARRAPPRA